jgi:cytochrome c oxidase assembly protein subunit 15
MAYAVLLAVLWHVRSVWRRNADAPARKTAALLAGAVVLQALLGIWTLLAMVPLPLGLAHQAGAAAVFGLAIWHLHAVRNTR